MGEGTVPAEQQGHFEQSRCAWPFFCLSLDDMGQEVLVTVAGV